MRQSPSSTRLSRATLLGLLALTATGAAAQDSPEAAIRARVLPRIQEIARASDLVAAVAAQNGLSSGYSDAKIADLDAAWRAEVAAGGGPLMEAALNGPVAASLDRAQAEAAGLFSELILMDGKGLNVALSDPSSDYWQGDEPKFQKSFGAGADAVFIDAVEFDESSQTYQAQVSVPVRDAGGTPIGALTVGVVVDNL